MLTEFDFLMRPPLPEPGFLDFQGLRLATYDFPAAQAAPARRPVFLFHANGYAALTYEPLIRQWTAAGHRVLTMDFVGHGNSTATTAIPDWNFFRDQALALLDYSGLEECYVVGHSVGGAGARLAAARDGGRRIRGLALLDPTVFTPFTAFLLPIFPNYMARAAETRRALFPNLRLVARSYRMHPAFRAWDEHCFDAYLRASLRARPDGQYELCLPPAVEARIFRSFHRGQWRDHRNVHIPSLVLTAHKSPVCPPRAMALLCRGHALSRGEIHPSGSHFFPMEFPDWTARQVLDYFAMLDAQG